MNEPQKADEMKTLSEIVKKLDALNEAERRRAMLFLNDRYGALLKQPAPNGQPEAQRR